MPETDAYIVGYLLGQISNTPRCETVPLPEQLLAASYIFLQIQTEMQTGLMYVAMVKDVSCLVGILHLWPATSTLVVHTEKPGKLGFSSPATVQISFRFP